MVPPEICLSGAITGEESWKQDLPVFLKTILSGTDAQSVRTLLQRPPNAARHPGEIHPPETGALESRHCGQPRKPSLWYSAGKRRSPLRRSHQVCIRLSVLKSGCFSHNAEHRAQGGLQMQVSAALMRASSEASAGIRMSRARGLAPFPGVNYACPQEGGAGMPASPCAAAASVRRN